MFIPSKVFLENSDLRLGIICATIYFTITILGKFFVNHRFYFLPNFIALPISVAATYFGALYLFLMFIFDFYKDRPVFICLLGAVLIAVLVYKKLITQDKRQIFFFLTTLPVFALAVFNFIVYCPKVWAAEGFGKYKYYVIEEIYDYPHSDTYFLKCKKLSFQCDVLSGTQFARAEIIVDEDKKEVSFIDARGLVFTDGSNPRMYTGDEGGRLGNNLYYLAETCIKFNYDGRNECENYTFIPYECNLDNKSCDPLPIKIKSDYESYFYWEVNKVATEIDLLYSDDAVLFFTYGKHPKCYVEACEILQ